MRWAFAKDLIESETYKCITPQDHLGYIEAGKDSDSFIKRANYCKERHTLPLIRAHVGPYNPNRLEAIKRIFFMGKGFSQGASFRYPFYRFFSVNPIKVWGGLEWIA